MVISKLSEIRYNIVVEMIKMEHTKKIQILYKKFGTNIEVVNLIQLLYEMSYVRNKHSMYKPCYSCS